MASVAEHVEPASPTDADGSASGGSVDDCVRVTPIEFRLPVTGKAHQLDIKVQNKTDSLVAFKIKTTAPKRYMVRPTQDYIEPREDKVLKVVMTPKDLPLASEMKAPVRDSLRLQARPVSERVPDLSEMWKQVESVHRPKEKKPAYQEKLIRVTLLPPATETRPGETASSAASVSTVAGPLVPGAAPATSPPASSAAAALASAGSAASSGGLGVERGDDFRRSPSPQPQSQLSASPTAAGALPPGKVVVDADELAQLRKQAGAYNRAVQEAVEAKRAAAELHVHVKALDRQREEHEASLRALRDENERAQSGEPRRRKAAVEAQPAPSEPQGELLEETRVSGVRLEWWHLVLLIVGFFALGYFVG